MELPRQGRGEGGVGDIEKVVTKHIEDYTEGRSWRGGEGGDMGVGGGAGGDYFINIIWKRGEVGNCREKDGGDDDGGGNSPQNDIF